MSDIKDMKVLQIRCHVGIHLGALVVTSVDRERDRAEMSLTPVGVFIKCFKGISDANYIIPFSNLHSVKLEGSEPASTPAAQPKTKH
jgi:hypothetical protein